jgi:hypothetical protein
MGGMRCGMCGRMGIYWKNLTGMIPWTYCPHCEGTNCQEPEKEVEEPDENYEEEQP